MTVIEEVFDEMPYEFHSLIIAAMTVVSGLLFYSSDV
jgi:hypothetical protein